MPSFGVVVAVLRPGEVLLQMREDARLWNLPGGAVEDGESLAEAAVREVREETGVAVAVTRLVGTYSRPRWRKGGNHQILFAARVVDGSPDGYVDAETVEARFFRLDALPDDLLWWHRRLIADAAAGEAGVAWTQDVSWPGQQDRAQTVARYRSDPAFAAELRLAFTVVPPNAERCEAPPGG
jgi:ADP-ribose pyrophosphatase YjhB (NUDIX family)